MSLETNSGSKIDWCVPLTRILGRPKSCLGKMLWKNPNNFSANPSLPLYSLVSSKLKLEFSIISQDILGRFISSGKFFDGQEGNGTKFMGLLIGFNERRQVLSSQNCPECGWWFRTLVNTSLLRFLLPVDPVPILVGLIYEKKLEVDEK